MDKINIGGLGLENIIGKSYSNIAEDVRVYIYT